MQTKFKVGDVVRAVKVCTKEDFTAEGCSNSWTSDMTAGVERKIQGKITGFDRNGILFEGDNEDKWWPSAAFELVAPAIDWSKPVQTTDGDLVTIVTRARRGTFSILGYIGDSDDFHTWTADGKFRTISNSVEDLMNVPEKPKNTTVYFNVFERDGKLYGGYSHASREAADNAGSAPSRVGCIKVDFVAGQFDN